MADRQARYRGAGPSLPHKTILSLICGIGLICVLIVLLAACTPPAGPNATPAQRQASAVERVAQLCQARAGFVRAMAARLRSPEPLSDEAVRRMTILKERTSPQCTNQAWAETTQSTAPLVVTLSAAVAEMGAIVGTGGDR